MQCSLIIPFTEPPGDNEVKSTAKGQTPKKVKIDRIASLFSQVMQIGPFPLALIFCHPNK